MTREWQTLAGQVATLRRRVAELELEVAQYKAAEALREAQMRRSIVTLAPADDVIQFHMRKQK